MKVIASIAVENIRTGQGDVSVAGCVVEDGTVIAILAGSHIIQVDVPFGVGKQANVTIAVEGVRAGQGDRTGCTRE